MPRATFRFHGGLNDFLPPGRREVPNPYAFEGAPAIKDSIEALGIPHPEVDRIVVNGESVGFDRPLVDLDSVDVYPPGWVLDLPGSSLAPPVPDPPRFVLDTHLGKLAGYLRLLGLDTIYANSAGDEELARRASDEARVLLTRDRALLKRSVVVHGYLVRSDDPRRQLVEVVDRYGLRSAARPFQRCIRCNGRIEAVDRASVAHLLQPKTLRYFDSFGQCDACGAVYWKGSHFDRMTAFLAEVLGDRVLGEQGAGLPPDSSVGRG